MITWAKDPRMKARSGEEWVGLIFIGEHPPTRDRSLRVLGQKKVELKSSDEMSRVEGLGRLKAERYGMKRRRRGYGIWELGVGEAQEA
jgi:hypothetical protein